MSGQTKAEAKSTNDRFKPRGQAGKKTKDPNKPKRPPTAFFVFLDDFRREFNKANPKNKAVAAVSIAAGAKWKSMTAEDKAPYVAKAESKKSEYFKTMQEYNRKLAKGTNTTGDDDSDKSKSEVSDEEEGVSEEGNSEGNNQKRKREEENEAKDTTMVLLFEKKLPIWKTVESMEAFKTFPQSPHFSPLVGTSEDSRELSAVGLMLTFSGLLEEFKKLKHDDPTSSLISLNDSFVELEKHGFDIKAPQLRIVKLLSLRDTKAKKMEELKDVEKATAEKERVKVENERKILELQKVNGKMNTGIAQSKSCATTIARQLEKVGIQFQTTASAPW